VPDALVIGAGPAGSVAARELARRGVRVLLVDKAHFPRPKVCGCCLNGAAVRTLRRLGLGDVLAAGVPLRDALIGAGRRTAGVPLPGGVALSREAFDPALIAAAVRAGAEFRPGVAAKFVPGGPALVGGVAVRSNVTVLAGGLAGGDATPEPGSRIGAGTTVPADAVPAFFRPGTIFMATARGGYVGLVRVEDGRLDVAAAFDVGFVRTQGGLGPAAAAVLGAAGWPRVPGLAELAWRGTPALTRRTAALAGAGWFAVGDAAGYVEPFTGEGMAWAVTSAAAVAPLAARAARGRDDSLAAEWAAAHRRLLGGRQRACRVVARALRYPALTALAVRALAVLPGLARPLVAALNRPPSLRRDPRA
jgi:flavin-dependent dehydrogenase